jgi:hypothetical protein
MAAIMRKEGHFQHLESLPTASGASHRCVEKKEEEVARKLIALAMATKWEEDAE